ncbi:CLUMA_CG012761, isoform A [Clunio marinus]|uniref:CLUMA_CG012761, isoform A n=1 Tax=Clunio marinus TaxID=568069 RepID=A0A1J1IGK1_9DIPT|nr:CLUMA_CG012761, isoform A [Clunio marinus]
MKSKQVKSSGYTVFLSGAVKAEGIFNLNASLGLNYSMKIEMLRWNISIWQKFFKFGINKGLVIKHLIEVLPPEFCRFIIFNHLESLEKRRQNAGHLFIAGILNGTIDSNELLSALNINTSMMTSRTAPLLRDLSRHKTDYGRNNPLSRMAREFKEVQSHFEFHRKKEDSKNKLKLN